MLIRGCKTKNSRRLIIFDITLMGIILALHLVVMLIAKFTLLKILPIKLEFIFYIFYGIIFGPWKGVFISIVADTFVLLITGSIGTWYWMYALIPPAIALFSAIYYFIFKKSKIFGFVSGLVMFIVSLTVMLIVVKSKVEPDTGLIKISKKLSFTQIFVYLMIAIYFILGAIIFTIILIKYIKYKNNKSFNYLFVFSLITIIMLIFRWTLDPLLYISWYNYYRRSSPKFRLKTVGDDYIIIFIPIVIKSLISMPFYIIVLTPVYDITAKLKAQHMAGINKIKW